MRLQFHLSTALVLMFAAGIFLHLNTREWHTPTVYGEPAARAAGYRGQEKQIEVRANGKVRCWLVTAHGWPFAYQTRRETIEDRPLVPDPIDDRTYFADFPRSFNERKTLEHARAYGGQWDSINLFNNFVVCAAILIIIGALFEWLISRRVKPKPHAATHR